MGYRVRIEKQSESETPTEYVPVTLRPVCSKPSPLVLSEIGRVTATAYDVQEPKADGSGEVVETIEFKG
jgi:hypothetical protein